MFGVKHVVHVVILYSPYTKSKHFTRSSVTDFKAKGYDNLYLTISQITRSNADLDMLEEKFSSVGESQKNLNNVL